jgi:hypothetical protein
MDHSHQEEERASKRARIDQNDHDSTEHLSSEQVPLSIEQHLSIPLVVMFRQASSSNRSKPLLTRAEAQAMLRINMLSQEVDCLVQLASEALDKKRWCKSMEPTLVSHPVLRSLVPLLHCHGKNHPTKALAYIQQELSRVLHEMTSLATMIQQFAEQNFTLAESLLDALGDNALAEEKKLLGDLEEELSGRCNGLLQMTEGQLPFETQNRSPMNTFCENLFGESFKEPQRLPMDIIIEEDHHEEKSVEEITNYCGEATESGQNSKLPSDIRYDVPEAITGAVVMQLVSTPTKNIGNDKHPRDVGDEMLEGANFTMAVPGVNGSEAGVNGSEVDTDCIGTGEPQLTRGEDVSPSISPAKGTTLEQMANIEMYDGASVPPCNKSSEKEKGSASQLIPGDQLVGEKTTTRVPTGQGFVVNEESRKRNSQDNRTDAALALMLGAKAANSPHNEPETMNISDETHVTRLPHECLPSIRGVNGALELQLPVEFWAEEDSIDRQTSKSPTPSPPLIEPDNEMIPNTQTAVHALAGLSYGN